MRARRPPGPAHRPLGWPAGVPTPVASEGPEGDGPEAHRLLRTAARRTPRPLAARPTWSTECSETASDARAAPAPGPAGSPAFGPSRAANREGFPRARATPTRSAPPPLGVRVQTARAHVSRPRYVVRMTTRHYRWIGPRLGLPRGVGRVLKMLGS